MKVSLEKDYRKTYTLDDLDRANLVSMDVRLLNDDNSEANAETMYSMIETLRNGVYLQEYIHADGTSLVEIIRVDSATEKDMFLRDMCEMMPIKEGMEMYMDSKHEACDIVGYYGNLVTVCKLTFIK